MKFLMVLELAKVTTGVSRRMRHAYSSLDSLNFRFGQALRRRPAARLVLFFYVSEEILILFDILDINVFFLFFFLNI